MIKNAAIETLLVVDELSVDSFNNLSEEDRQIQGKLESLEQNLEDIVSIFREKDATRIQEIIREGKCSSEILHTLTT